jgi:signal transduction histidine kinase
MPKEPVRILLVDDDEDDFLLTRELLSEIPDTDFVLDWISDYDEAIELICKDEHDLYLIDYRLGDKDGLALIREVKEKRCHVAMILLTGLGERTIDFAAMEAGAADYLEKTALTATRLERSIRYSLQSKRHAEELDQRVRERTEELARSNASLQEEIAERARAEAALREADRRKNEFLATLAHELRNPLAPIRNSLEIMKLSNYAPDTVKRSLGIIERQTSQLVRLIEDLLDISRVSRGKIQIRKSLVEIASVVESALESVAPLIEERGHALKVTLPKEPLHVLGDAARLSQTISNLLNNAAKYTPPKGRVELAVEPLGNEIRIRVRDNGIGIAADALTGIFEMFTQAGRATEHSLGGVGIGLWLVRALVGLHGGRIEASSAGVGEGSEFRVWLPRAHAGATRG